MKALKIKHLFALFVLLFIYTLSYSQTETDEKAFIDFTDGVGFVTPDSVFGMNIRFRMQNRAGFLHNPDTYKNELEATVKRCRLRFDGFIKDTDLTYYLQLSFSRGDMAIDDMYVHNIVRDAMIYYRFNKNFYIGFGQGKLPGNRQRVISSGMQQFAERSIVNARFNIDRDFGIMGYYTNNLGFLHYNLKGAVTTGEGRNVVFADDNLAYTGRIEILPFGRFTNNGDFFEADLEREASPKLSLAAGISQNLNANKTNGQRGDFSPEKKDITTYFADFMFKYSGWNLSGEYLRKIVTNPIVLHQHHDNLDNDLIFFTGYGINTQLSYLFQNNFEVAGRYSYIEPHENMPEFIFYDHAYSLGVTNYINNHRTKLQLNLNYFGNYSKSPLIKDIHNFGAMIQVEIGI